MKHWLIKGYIFLYDQLLASRLAATKQAQKKAMELFVKLSFAR